jgi:HYDIN/CFA65/VesB family protein/ASPM-SPD-2-Hydin domain-containing protein
MKRILLLTLVLGFACNLASAQTSSITIPANGRIYVPDGGRVCPDTIYVYGTLECDNLACICSSCKVMCFGTCIPPELSGEQALINAPASVDFGNVDVGSFQNMVCTIVNTGTKALNVSSTLIAPPPFTITQNGGPRTIQPGSSVKITLTFTPTGPGNFTGTLTVMSDAANFPSLDIALTGRGTQGDPVIEVNTHAVDFGTITLGTNVDKTVTIRNTGTSPLILTDQTVSGPGFSLRAAASTPIAPGSSADATIRFSPTAVITSSGTFTIQSNDPASGTVIVALSGISIDPQPNIFVDPDPVSFGQVTVGSQADRIVTVTNGGTADLVLSSQTVSSGMYSLVSPANATIAPGASSTATLRFQPTSAGSHMGTYSVESNDPFIPTAAVQLLGSGTTQQTCLTTAPTTLAFGETQPLTPLTLDISIANSCSAPLTVNLTVMGNEFSLDSQTPISVPATGKASAIVRFNPAVPGQYSGTLTVRTNSPAQSIEVPLIGSCKGTISGARISADNTTINFGSIAKGVPKLASLQVSNIGDQDLVFSKQFVTSGDSSVFSIATLATSPLAPGNTSMMELRASSPVDGMFVSKLRLETNDNVLPRFDVSLVVNVVTGVEPLPGVPTGIALHQNYPNPFNPSTEIDYEVDRPAYVKLDVYSSYGELVTTLVDRRQAPGIYKTTLDASGLPSGVYAAVLRVSDTKTQHVRTIMMTLMK